MKMNIKKVATVLGSALMIGATAGMAAAAAYPAPFVSNGAANVAIVVGGNAALSDGLAASAIAADLATDLAAQTATSGTTGTSTVEGGDSYKIEKASNKFNVGDAVTDVIGSSSITADDLPALLSDGKFVDKNNDEFDYTQEIDMNGTLALKMFESGDYKTDTPTLGFSIPSGQNILTYTLEFQDTPEWADLKTTDIPFMGRTYYVLNNGTVGQELTLLDSATTTTVAEGESTTVQVGDKSYEVSTSFVGDTSVKLIVNGQTTNSIAEGRTYKLSDGAFIGIKDIMYSSKDSGVSKVEFSLGKGELVLTDGSDVELNDETISGLVASFENETTQLVSISIAWAAEDDLYLAEDSEIVMPGFNAVKLSFGGITVPTTEKIELANNGEEVIALNEFPLKTSTEDINLFYLNQTSGNYTGLGKDADEQLLVSAGDSIVFDADDYAYFIASWNDTRSSETYLMRATNFKIDNEENKTTIEYKSDGAWTAAKTDAKLGSKVSLGNIELTVGTIDKVGKSVNLSAGTDVVFDTIYSKEGMRVTFPLTVNASTASTLQVNFTEENEDEDVAAGDVIVATIASRGDSPNKEVTVSTVTGFGAYSEGDAEVGSSDVFEYMTYSELATMGSYDKSGDQYTLALTYHGSEVVADVYLTAPEAIVSSGSSSTGSATQLGAITIKDSEVSSVSGKNLIVIGGSCVNSVAAELLGGAACEAAFTAASGVKAGEALIKSFARGDKVALLVAGYNAEDTTKAATYLTMKGADTTVGTALKVTSATEATAITA